MKFKEPYKVESDNLTGESRNFIVGKSPSSKEWIWASGKFKAIDKTLIKPIAIKETNVFIF